MRTAPPSESILTRAFALLCLAQFLGYAHHFILQPTLPLYITHLGGTPFIGAWVDRWHGGGVMVSGLLFLAGSVLFCFLPFVSATILTNGLRGIGWAGLNTGGYTMLATSAPPARRGEASGYYGAAQVCGTIFFPAVALWIIALPASAAIGGSRILVLAMEQAPSERRGRAMASFSMAFPLSNGIGAFLNGLVVDLAGYEWMYVTAAALCSTGLILTWRYWAKLK